MSRLRRSLLAVVLLGSMMLTACAASRSVGVVAEPPSPALSGLELKTETPPEPPPVQARILATGDLLMHLPLVNSSALPGGGWDFQPLFAHVRPWIEDADYTIGELETTLTGSRYPWSGYPSFNTPPELARDIKAVGFDAVTHANNHSLDYSEYGLQKTSEALEAAGLAHTGTNRTPEEQNQMLVVEVAPTIRMALFAYTYGTNGIPLPQPYSVNLLDPERIAADIRRARTTEGVDLVAVALHFGDEDIRYPNDQQKALVDLAINAGADIILGDHVHVIQPIEVRRMVDQFGRDKVRVVNYSFGNLISNQVKRYQKSGLMLLIDVRKEKGETTIEQVGYIPVWTHAYGPSGQQKYRVVAVEKAIKDYEAGVDPLVTAADYEALKQSWGDTTSHAPGTPDVVLIHTGN